MDGYPLMQTVFSAKTPKLVIADTSTDTGENVQRGFMDMFAGAAAALRNPKAHENDFITAENAARQLMFASMLMYELDEALEREENSTIAAVEKVQLVADTDFASNGHRRG